MSYRQKVDLRGRDAQEIALLLAFARLLALFSLELRNVHQESLGRLLDGAIAEKITRLMSEPLDHRQIARLADKV